MMDLLSLIPSKRRVPAALLGLALDGNRLDGVVLKRLNGSLQLQQSFSVTLSLDPLNADPELVGRELRNHLDAAGVRERHCVVSLPLKWALTIQSELPDLPEEDLANFLAIEAERRFPCDVTTLRLATSRCDRLATQIGIPSNHIATLENVLEKARLKPLSFSLGITALQSPDTESSHGVLALAIGQTDVNLQITVHGGVAALRALEGALETEAGRHILNADLVAREIRITLGQLPAAVRETVRRVRVFGPTDLARQLADELELRLESYGLDIEAVTTYAPDDFPVQLPPGATVSRAFSLAAHHLARRGAVFEFLPPKVTAWQRIATRYSSGRLRMAAAIAGGALVLVGGPFLYQQIQLMILQSRWAAISARVNELETIQQKIRQYRPWFDNSLRSLDILRQLTLAFPEDNSVSAKMIEIRNGATVTCSGVARDNASLLRTLTALRGAAGVADLKVDQIRGNKTVQFSFDFRWNEGGARED